MLLLIDNYDSFTFNLYQMIGEIYPNIKVVRNDEIKVEDIKKLDVKGIIISPGPGTPEKSGISVEVIKEYGKTIPILGICLGHQAIGYAFNGKVLEADKIMHGKTSFIKNNGQGLFKGLKENFKVMRYHSLIVEKASLPQELEVTAETEDGVIMGLKHKQYPIYGLQFHPESILTEYGSEMLKNFVMNVLAIDDCYEQN
ncbi:aminodeoxychorismate/anthranilate synthase component II [Clostridium sp. BSD9I1]|uniref:anthranilate synthase component II n=1 Tax=Clostridium sp. BSD9I1 TaxID=2003589 RepID=UPI001646D8A9|nr:aminodeoxychorismate/anthranilate synthase component II [Clostridium sp. BSD9I1]